MSYYHTEGIATVLHGDCLNELRTIPDNSIDAVVTDPPYGLSNTTPAQVADTITRWVSGDREYLPTARGFMGHEWDGFVPPVAVWDECLRVLKPGGHLLAFAGSRTHDLMTLGIRLAGFEIRDSVAWLHAQGFPKSHNVANSAAFCGCTGVPCKNEAEPGPEHKMPRLRHANVPEAGGAGGGTGEVLLQGLQESRTPSARREELPDAEARRGESRLARRGDDPQAEGELHRPQVCEVPGGMADDGPEGRVHHGASPGHGPVGRQAAGSDGSGESHQPRPSGQSAGEPGAVPVERGSQARRGWPVCSRCGKPSIPDGLGTALKPAFEPVTLARKPLAGTVAANVQEHGTGALNIDGCRVGSERTMTRIAGGRGFGANFRDDGWVPPAKSETRVNPSGRWPANVVLDESQAAELDRQVGPVHWQATNNTRKSSGWGVSQGKSRRQWDAPKVGAERLAKEGPGLGPSKFFYVAKAPKSERPVVDGTAHPTVKPLALMQWLIRMVTPPGGTVLDPFAGSGTTLEAAVRENVQSIGIEREADYLPLIKQRLERAVAAKDELTGSTPPPPKPKPDDQTALF